MMFDPDDLLDWGWMVGVNDGVSWLNTCLKKQLLSPSITTSEQVPNYLTTCDTECKSWHFA